MKQSEYCNAVDKLEFSQIKAARVRKLDQGRPKFRLVRAAVLAAVLCLMLATTVAAAGQWLLRDVHTETLGTVQPDTQDTLELAFNQDAQMDDILVHTMKLNDADYFLFGSGLLYSRESGFLRVEEDYSLTSLESREIALRFEKDGFLYSQDLCFVETENGLVSDQMFDYPLVEGRALVNLWCGNQRCWPVWVDVSTGEWEDALPGFHAEDFAGEVKYVSQFRGGLMISCVAEARGSMYYWIEEGSAAAQMVEMPEGALDFVLEDELLYRDGDWNYYTTRGGWEFYPVEGVPKTSDAMWQGLITCVSESGTLQIYDLLTGEMYDIPDISALDPWIQEKSLYDPELSDFNATRNSGDGSIVVTHAYHDFENLRRMMDSIAYLDQETMELKQLEINANKGVWTLGWLDDHRYCVITEDENARWLTIYEFGA